MNIIKKIIIWKVFIVILFLWIILNTEVLSQCDVDCCQEEAWWFVYQEGDQYFVRVNDEVYGAYSLADNLQVNGRSWGFVYQIKGQYFIKINGIDFGPFENPVNNFLMNSRFQDYLKKDELENNYINLNTQEIEIDIYKLPVEYLLGKGDGYIIRGYPKIIKENIGLDELNQAQIIPIEEATYLRNYDIVVALDESEITIKGLRDLLEMFKIKINSRSVMQYVVLDWERKDSFQYENNSQEVKIEWFYSWLFSKQLEHLVVDGDYLKIKYLESGQDQIRYKFKSSQVDKYLSFHQIPFGLKLKLNVEKNSLLVLNEEWPSEILALSSEEVGKFVQDKSQYLKNIIDVWLIKPIETCLQKDNNLSGSIFYYFRDQKQDNVFVKMETNQIMAAVRWTELGICVGEETTKLKVLKNKVEVQLVKNEKINQIIATDFEAVVNDDSDFIEVNAISEDFYKSAGFQSLNEEMSFSLLSDTTNSKWQESIDFLIEEWLIEGYQDGTFKGLQEIDRVEALKLIILSKYSEEEIASFSGSLFCFPDIVEEKWYNQIICFAKEKWIVEWYGDGFFKAENQVTLVEVLKILMETYNYEIRNQKESEAWYWRYVEIAKNKGLIPIDFENKIVENINREEMAEVVARTIKKDKNKE